MKIFTIERKTSNSGNIHDITSEYYDRVIKFRKGTKYAVVLASFYGDHYTTHKTERAAIRMARNQSGWSLRIIDADGNQYEDNQNGSLEKVES